MSDFFFLDDMDDAREYISVSVGEVWLYFFKETLIGVRDMRTSKIAYLEPVGDSRPDGYSHRHEIGVEQIEMIRKEPYPKTDERYLSAIELSALAIEWIAHGLVQRVDEALRA